MEIKERGRNKLPMRSRSQEVFHHALQCHRIFWENNRCVSRTCVLKMKCILSQKCVKRKCTIPTPLSVERWTPHTRTLPLACWLMVVSDSELTCPCYSGTFDSGIIIVVCVLMCDKMLSSLSLCISLFLKK